MPFNPINSITGNGQLSVVATYNSATTSWSIFTENLPGDIRYGTFPNSQNPYSIVGKNLTYVWPYRGSKNLPATTPAKLNSGVIGISAVGIVFYSPDAGVTAAGTGGTVWTVNANSANILGQDIYGGDVTSDTFYHYRDNRFINNDAWGSLTDSPWENGVYRNVNGHSKIIGWAKDGYPIYGPYGYVNPLSTSSGVARMVSGYVSSIKPNRPSNRTLIVNGNVTATNVVRIYSSTGVGVGMRVSNPSLTTSSLILNVFGTTLTLDSPVTLISGAALVASYAEGAFLEDWTYNRTDTNATLDAYNGRWCITPDYPEGTYAYFATETSSGKPAYPYFVGPYYYGSLDPDSNDSSLTSLLANVGSLTPTFTSTVTNYSLTVLNTVTSVRFLAVSNTATSSIVVNTATVASGVISQAWPLVVGNNTSTIKVTSQYKTTSTYTVVVNRLRSPIKTLAGLAVTPGTLTPAFKSTVTNYSLVVDQYTGSVSILATKTDANSIIRLNGSVISSATAYPIGLSFGINIIPLTVTAEDGTTSTYTLNITKLSNVSLLSNIQVSTGTISPSFNKDVFYYNVNLPNNVTSIATRAVVLDSGSSIEINGNLVASGQYYTATNLTLGSNPINISVVSSDGSTQHFYRVTAYRAFSNTATLSSLLLSVGSLSPAFSSTITNYTVNVANNVSNIRITPTTRDVYATMTINNAVAYSGQASSSIDLGVGGNTIDIEVTAPDLSTVKTYTLNVVRAGSNVSTLTNLVITGGILSPAFKFNTYNYTSNFEYVNDRVTVIPETTQPDSTVLINNVSVLSGQESAPIVLGLGYNTIQTVVTSQDGANTSVYNIVIFRKSNYNSKLASIDVVPGPLNPSFDSDVTEYSYAVSHYTTTTDIVVYASDVDASVKINNKSTSSGVVTTVELSGSYILNTVTNKQVWAGQNIINIEVTAADPAYKTNYKLYVDRLANSVSTLSNLLLDIGPLSPAFESNTTEYILGVPFSTSTVRVRAFKTDPGSTITILGNELASGVLSSPLPLSVGNNSVPILVTAANKKDTTGYTIYINRAGQGLSPNALLSSLELNTGTFTPVFNSNVISYQTTVDYTIQSLKLKPTKANTYATIKVNGVLVTSGQYSQAITIPAGNSSIVVQVTAEDQVTIKEYTLSVKRLGSANSYLQGIFVSDGYLNETFNKNVYQYTVNIPYHVRTVSVKPVVDDIQSQQSVNKLGVVLGAWSSPVTTVVGNNVLTIVVLAGDLISESTYKVNFIRANAVLTNPSDLFLIDTDEIVEANLIQQDLFRIYTTVSVSKVARGNFPGVINRFPILAQDIELIYPYRGGQQIMAATPPNRPVKNIIGITVVGIPLYDPNSGVTVTGTNFTSWTFDKVSSKIFGEDLWGGGPDNAGVYHYCDHRFILNDAWANTEKWLGDYTHDDGHSKIIGFAADGYPIYGPYGYTQAGSSYGGVSYLTSGYIARELPNRPTEVTVITDTAINGNIVSVFNPAGVKVGMRLKGGTISTSTDAYIISITNNVLTLGENIQVASDVELTAYYPLGVFIEDWYYKGNNSTLDINNGRYCVTPDYPFGTYAYFAPTNPATLTPAYPYFVGNTFYGSLGPQSLGAETPPIWKTPEGFIVTATETVSISRTVIALGSNVSYKLITGSLPSGISLNTSTGVISGRPGLVYQTIRSEFVIRALNAYGVADQRFFMDVQGPTPPLLTTAGPKPAVGPSGETYLVNGQFVDFQFNASTDILPTGQSLVYYIEAGQGDLPPGLILSQSGRLYGQVQDKLSLFYQAASDGTYDAEGYDYTPYEHESLQAIGIGPRYVNKVYKFYLTVSNGVGTNRAQYQIDVNDPTYYVDQPGKYPIPPQWMTATDLGSVRSNTKQVIQLETYDCDPGGGTITYDWFIVNSNLPVLPPDLTLDTTTGVISGYLRYTPIYTSTYTFKVRVIKTSIKTGGITYRDKTFSLTILGATVSKMSFVTPSLVGSLNQGEQSELSVLAVHSDPTLKIRYSLTSGSLPPGISLASDGALQGKLTYNTTATLTTYSFTVKAIDSNLGSQIVNNFSIVALPYNGAKYTQILLHPMLPKETRAKFEDFITDQSIFNPEIMYRPYDSAFGVQPILEMVLEHGIKQINLTEYASAMQNYFYRKRLYFGKVKSAFANDANGNKLYEVVYVEMVDDLVNADGVPINPVVSYNNTVIYPNSIDGMRGALESLSATDEYLLPKFMRTIQDNTGIPLGRILCIPLCYCLPGYSESIIRKIEASGMDFKLMNFDLDRITILNTLDNTSAKYLLFPNREVLQ